MAFAHISLGHHAINQEAYSGLRTSLARSPMRSACAHGSGPWAGAQEARSAWLVKASA